MGPLEHRLRILATPRASAVVSLIDADGVIRYQSPSIKWLLGYRPEQLLGRPLAAFLHSGSRRPAAAARRRMTHRGQLFGFWHLRFRNASGHTCWLRGEASNFLDDAGLRGIVVFWKAQAPRTDAPADAPADAPPQKQSPLPPAAVHRPDPNSGGGRT